MLNLRRSMKVGFVPSIALLLLSSACASPQTIGTQILPSPQVALPSPTLSPSLAFSSTVMVPATATIAACLPGKSTTALPMPTLSRPHSTWFPHVWNPSMPGLMLEFDPSTWQVDKSNNLARTSQPACQISSTSPKGLEILPPYKKGSEYGILFGCTSFDRVEILNGSQLAYVTYWYTDTASAGYLNYLIGVTVSVVDAECLRAADAVVATASLLAATPAPSSFTPAP